MSFAVRDSRFPRMCRAVPLSSSVFLAACALSAPTGHLPLEGKATIREYPLLKKRRATLVSLSSLQAPSSRAQPRDLYCTTALCTHAPSLKRHLGASLYRRSLTHGLPVCKKDFSASALVTRKKDGCLTSFFIPLRRVVPLRGTLSCAFGAALLQGPTRIIGVTGDL